jgi:hypothetical protein
LARVNELAAETAKRMRAIGVNDKTVDKLRILAVQLETAARNAAKVDIGGLTSRVSLELEALRDATERAKDATGTARSQAMEVLFTQLVRVAQVEREINDMIALNVGTARQRNQLQERLIELKRAERAANQETIQSMDIFLPGLREELTRQADRLKGAQATLEVAIRIPDNDQAVRQAKQAISRIQQEVGEALKASLSGGLFEFLDKAGQADVLRQVDATMKELGIDGRTFNEELERTDKILDRISIGFRGIGEIFEAIGVEAKEARELVRGLNLAVDSIKQVRATLRARRERSTEDPFDLSKPFDPGFNVSEMVALFSGIAGTIGSVVSIIGAVQSIISSQSRMQQEHNEIIRKNNDHLAEMTSQLRGFTLSVGNQLRVQRAVIDPRVQDAIRGAAPRQALEAIGTLPLGSTMAEINKELARFGLTFADVNRVAKENGIDLLDKKGRIVAGTFDQLAKAIEINTALLTTYGDTLADQAAKVDLYNDVFRRRSRSSRTKSGSSRSWRPSSLSSSSPASISTTCRRSRTRTASSRRLCSRARSRSATSSATCSTRRSWPGSSRGSRRGSTSSRTVWTRRPSRSSTCRRGSGPTRSASRTSTRSCPRCRRCRKARRCRSRPTSATRRWGRAASTRA